MSNQKKIIVVSTDFGTEQPEIVVPVTKLRDLGHDVTVATPTGEDVQTMVDDKDKGEVFPPTSSSPRPRAPTTWWCCPAAP